VTQLIPGALFEERATVRINGAPANTEGLRIEGQDATNTMRLTQTAQNQPSVEAIEEFAVQTSNYSAEYGQAGGGFFNITMKSGTNQFHGSAYDYWINEAFNANDPFVNIKDMQRRHNFGFTFGGPVWIPNVYDGHDKTFFFFNFEQFRETLTYNSYPQDFPVDEYRQGDFRRAQSGRSITTLLTGTRDPLGRVVYENTIYDPRTDRNVVYNGVTYTVRDPFTNNTIPSDRFDPVAVRIQDLIPSATNNDVLYDNYLSPWSSPNHRTIPSIKVDHNFGSRSKLSVYWSTTRLTATDQYPFCDGISSPISGCRNSYGRSHTARINYDISIAPTKLLHLGTGLHTLQWNDDANYTDFDQEAELGLPQVAGAGANIFPYMSGLYVTSYGGMKNMGPSIQSHELMWKPTANASLTWVKTNHTYKFGAELRVEGYPTEVMNPTYGAYTFSRAQTAMPIDGFITSGSRYIGFPYASFLLGLVDNYNIGAPATPRLGKTSWAFFAQDSWKVTRKFTLDYGLRYDYQGYLNDSYGRIPNFSPTALNPNAGNLLGAMIFERNGVEFSSVYPYAFGPRLGAAYQITPKTVFRAGVGIAYGSTSAENRLSYSIASNNPHVASSYGYEAMTLEDGPAPDGTYIWPDLNPGQFNISGAPVSITNNYFDSGAGRPPRMVQWSIGLQREVTKDLMVEASYVGNRGVWWEGNELININALSAERLASFGLDLNDAADRALLQTPWEQAPAPFNTPPYAGFAEGQTVAQTLRPYPQFTNIRNRWSPLGKTWYDSLQIKVTKRFSYGLDFTSSFTWQKEMAMGSEQVGTLGGTTGGVVNNVFERHLNKYISGYSRPIVWITSLNYTLPTLGINRALSWAIRDWRIGAVLNYASGRPIQVPSASNNLSELTFQGTFANRVPGESLWTPGVDINDPSTYDPSADFVLNPDAWENPPEGQYSYSPAYYSDYRYQRRPSEKISIGRLFRLKEGITLHIRADFDNAFNRLVTSNPASTDATAVRRTSNGIPTSGFGYINTIGSTATRQPRSGIIVARIQF
jgi:hypothetical protein